MDNMNNHSNTINSRPAKTDEAWFVVNVATSEIVAGPTTSRKADNVWKRVINFGNPIENSQDFRTCHDPEFVFFAEAARNDVHRNGMSGASESSRRFCNQSAARAAGIVAR